MVKGLRKRHLLVWQGLAMALPSGILVAWLAIPKQPVQPLLQPELTTPLPVILKRSDKQNYTVIVRGNTEGAKLQLEWINKIPLQYPTAIIYAGTAINDLDKARPIGRLEARGSSYFPLDSTFNARSGNSNHFILYDFIHQQVIDTINFTP